MTDNLVYPDGPMTPCPTLDEFLAAYEGDDNEWWRAPCGCHQNWFEEAVDRWRARDSELAAARAVTQRLLNDGWWPILVTGKGHEPWTWVHRNPNREPEPMSDAERAWLASVSPPTSGPGGYHVTTNGEVIWTPAPTSGETP